MRVIQRLEARARLPRCGHHVDLTPFGVIIVSAADQSPHLAGFWINDDTASIGAAEAIDLLHLFGNIFLEEMLRVKIQRGLDAVARAHDFFVAIFVTELFDDHLGKVRRCGVGVSRTATSIR